MFSTGTLVCMFSSVGGALVGVLLALISIVLREKPAVIGLVALLLNTAIVIFAYS